MAQSASHLGGDPASAGEFGASLGVESRRPLRSGGQHHVHALARPLHLTPAVRPPNVVGLPRQDDQ